MARAASPGLPGNGAYAVLATRPLHVLAFLSPLILLYELGSMWYLAGRGAETIGARGILGSFFHTFGVAGLHLPPVTLVVVLLAWHFALRDPLRIRPVVLLGMGAESALWSVPLLVVGLAMAAGAHAARVDGSLAGYSWQARLTVAVGAGLYEELLFRLVFITAIHFALSDLLKLRSTPAHIIAILASAAAFALYHNVTLADAAQTRLLLFYMLAGAYFGALFVLRGFGVVVATHAMYDIAALLIFDHGRSSG